jgi:hypothetical protein
MRKQIVMGIVSMAAAIALSGCANGEQETSPNENEGMNTNMEENMDMDHSNMEDSGSGEVPEGLKVAENPTFKVGSKAIIKSKHMEGMKGAEATIVGAYDTVAYTVSYTSTNERERVENHTWVIHEEIEGTESEHMEGMEGPTADIVTGEETTVYMVDFISTSGEVVTNHKWVTESELSAK